MLLVSGGLDSTTLAYKLYADGVNFLPLFINYGQHCADTELATLSSVLPECYQDKIKVIDVSQVYRGSDSALIKLRDLWKDNISYRDLYLPYRSFLLFSVGASFAQTHRFSYLYAAFINSNHAQEIDCSFEFFTKLENLLSDYGSVQLVMPFRYMSKLEVAKIGIDLGAPISRTFSC